MNKKDLKVCVVGIGYVGLPLAVAFGIAGVETFGFDINKERVKELKRGFDRNDDFESEKIIKSGVKFSSDPKTIKGANFIIASIPTPVDEDNNPDLSYLESASKIIGKNLRLGSYVVFESTVYPGATEEVCIPIIEKKSGFKAGVDFSFGYSPERINPGDHVHTIDKVVKIVSGMNQKACNFIALVYLLICKEGVFKAKNVKTAEAAKVIENTQRDLNIALANELSIIFHKIGIDTKDVLEAAATKWNYLRFNPGLVGGHCVGVDPYYLVFKSQVLGYHPKVIGAGRETNDSMAKFVVLLTSEAFKEAGKKLEKSKILILGLTFKENVTDLRNSKVFDVIHELTNKEAEVFVYDPLVNRQNLKFHNLKLIKKVNDGKKYDGVIFCVTHKKLLNDFDLSKIKSISTNRPILIDVKSAFNKELALKQGFIYKSL